MTINNRTTLLSALAFAVSIFVIVSYFKVSEDVFKHEAYRHAAEASYGEEPKPEGHGR
jgi:hypothetical protein